MTIGAKIKYIRKKVRKYTQSYMTKRLGMKSQQLYGYYEKDSRDIKYSDLKRILNILGYEVIIQEKKEN